MRTAEQRELVCVIDDDAGMRGSLDSLLRSAGFAVRTFEGPQEYLACDAANRAACLVLDIRLGEVNGLDFQASLVASKVPVPVVLVTGHADISMTVRGMKAGAVNFLPKPFAAENMVAAVTEAVERDRRRRSESREHEHVSLFYGALTRRERQVMSLVAAGLMNKQVAGRLGVTENTVKIYRGNLMRKMRAQSLADLVRMAEILEVRDSAATRRNGAG